MEKTHLWILWNTSLFHWKIILSPPPFQSSLNEILLLLTQSTLIKIIAMTKMFLLHQSGRKKYERLKHSSLNRYSDQYTNSIWESYLHCLVLKQKSVLKEISPEYSLEGLMLKLNLQYAGHLMWRTDSLKKTLMLGKIESGRRRGQQRMRQLHGITDVMNTSLSWWWTGKPGMLQSMGLQKVRHNWVTELNWTELWGM